MKRTGIVFRNWGLATVVVLPFMTASGAVGSPDIWKREWPATDFSMSSVSYGEITSGGPPKDGIPALANPRFILASDEDRLFPVEPVMSVAVDGQSTRAYPIRYLLWHEIVNDSIGDLPIAVTYCPLCNSGIVFDRRVGERTLTFGVTGKLRNSDMVMYDRETESWWQQAVGEAIVGELLGESLLALPARTTSWEEFLEVHGEEALVMDEPDYVRPYGSNPYVGYDSSARPFLYTGDLPPHDILPLARVVRVDDTAWPLERLRKEGEITENGFVLSWRSGQSSPLDTRSLASGKDIGTVRVVDEATGNDAAHDVLFAFAYHAFFPEGKWMLGD